MSKEINNLNKPLKDQLGLDKKQDKTDNNLATTDKTIVGAINELFQSANNGKELIANAIGSPLSKNDTFSAMSNKINSLLSTFKTNMMNNGVTVNNGDKFKQLIDKIVTLSDNEGKGVQYAEFTTSVSFELNYSNPKYLNINGDYNFKPTHIILNFTEQTSGTPSNHQVITLNTFPGAATTFFSGSSGLSVRIESTEIGSVKLWYNGKGTSSFSSYRGYDVHCYLFGVGEEDTTLRDSLASILEEEGVSVTEEDDMASLISKVGLLRTLDNKFPDWYTPPSDGVWLEGPTVTYNYREGDITSYGDDLYITSGFNGGYSNNFYCFNIKNGVMTTKAKLPAVRFGNSIDCVGDKLYCIGGATYSNYWYTAQNTIYCYDPKTNSWTTKSGTLPEIRFGHTSAVVGSTIYILGGSGSGSNTGDGTSPDNSMIYDVLTDTCTTFTSQADDLYSSAVVLDNKIYVWGGGYYSNTSCGLLVYDLALKTWTTRYLNIYRSGSELLEYNGELYIYNGCSDEYNYAHLYKLNLDDLTLTSLTEPLTADYGGSVIVIDDKIYAFGGYANSTADKGGYGYRNTVRVFIF